MRRIAVVSLAAPLIALACSTTTTAPRELVGKVRSPIIGGTTDSTHTAVVALLAAAGAGSFDVCSGSIVKVQNGIGYVLTAAHCCGGDPQNPSVSPSIVVMASDYAPYEADIGNSNPAAPAYPVIPGTIAWDPAYASSNQQAYDFCMLQFSGASASTPTLQLPTSASDGLSVGVSVEFVGFGVTGTNSNNSVRYHVTSTVDQSVTSTAIQFTESSQGGPCSGDSGGPALIPAGAAQSQQVVVATTSYGDPSCNTYGVSMRVSSEIGPSGFITQYLEGIIDAGSASDGGGQSPCDSCISNVTSVNGACWSQVQTCQGSTDCVNLLTCLNGCAANDPACPQNCANQYPNGINDYNAISTCICTTGCMSQCATECAAPPTDGGAPGGDSGTSSGQDSGSSGHDSGSFGFDASSSGGDGGTSTDGGSGGGSGTDGGSDTFNASSSSGCSMGGHGPAAPPHGAAEGLLLGVAAAVVGRRRARSPRRRD